MKGKLFASAVLLAVCLSGASAQLQTDQAHENLYARSTRAKEQSQLRADKKVKTFFVAPLRYAVLDEGAKTVEVSKLQRQDPRDKRNFKNLVIPEKVTYDGASYTVVAIGAGAFNDPRLELENCTMPNSITIIKNQAFAYSRLKKIVIPDNVVELEEEAFMYVNKATELEIGANLLKIGKDAFYDLFYLKKIKLSPENKHLAIKDEILYDKDIKTMYLSPSFRRNFISYVLPETVEEIAPCAMMGNVYLKSLTLSQRLKKIGEAALHRCIHLESLELPSSLEEFDEVGSNQEMYHLKEFRVADANKHYTSINGLLYTKDKKTLLRYPQGHADSLNVVIPMGVEQIGESAFEACPNVEHIEVPQSVTDIHSRAFSETGIKRMRLPDKLEVLSPYLFYRCLSLEELHIGPALKTVLGDAFSLCSKLKRISIVAAEPPVFFAEEGDFNEFPDEIEEGSILTVSIGSANKYREAPEWKRFAQIVESANVSVDDVLDRSSTLNILVQDCVVHIHSSQPLDLVVFNLLGQKVSDAKSITNINLTLERGTYIIKAGNITQKIQVK
ncbi:MAG: leucine-rich repeat domain-containing protein [Porphyromonadaceae bacterium]|nr:leucine-rich repeat domain-containing protein [Porphyromonadaceae bacterium]